MEITERVFSRILSKLQPSVVNQGQHTRREIGNMRPVHRFFFVVVVMCCVQVWRKEVLGDGEANAGW